MRFFTPNPRPFQTALAMIGAKPGSQVLVIGAEDGRIAAAVAGVTGLNGRTVVIDPSPAAQPVVEGAAGEAGVLVEFETSGLPTLSSAANVFDVTVINQRGAPDAPDFPAWLAEAVRVTRPGGRIVVIEGAMATGWRARLSGPRKPPIDAGRIREQLNTAGLRAARVLAEADGVTYVEGARPRT